MKLTADQICSREHKRISKKTTTKIGSTSYSTINLAIYTEFEETVVLVMQIIGLAGVNGFDGLFSDEIDDDPRYCRSIAAFERIGAKKAVAVLTHAVALYFPLSKVCLVKPGKRKKITYELEGEFLEMEKKLIKKLAKYIKSSKKGTTSA